MDFIQAIIRPTYWVTHQLPVPEGTKVALFSVFGVIFAVGLLLSILSLSKKFSKPVKRLLSKLGVWGWVMGIWGIVQLFFSVEQVAYVSAKGFYLIWLGTAIFWMYLIINYATKKMPKNIERQKERDEAAKYLPKRKK